jgi:hypothetical protein
MDKAERRMRRLLAPRLVIKTRIPRDDRTSAVVPPRRRRES